MLSSTTCPDSTGKSRLSADKAGFAEKYFFTLCLSFLLTTQIGFAQFESKITESRFEYSSKILSNTSYNIDSLITTTMNNYHLPGLSACIVRDGEIIWEGVYGYADIENSKPVTDSTLFKVASLSKPFVGTALMQLWENGLFDLDEDINNYLHFQVRNPYHPNDPITFRMLLTHTSSILDNGTILNPLVTWGGDSPIPLDSFLVNYLVPGGIYYSNANYSTLAPLTSWNYSNVGATLIGYLVETISNIPFEQYCQDSIFIPLGMNEASWLLSNLDTNHIALPYYYSGGSYHSYGHYGMVTYPAGQLRTSAIQYSRHLIAFINKGQIEGVRILDSNTVNIITTIQFPNLKIEQALIWNIYPWTIPGLGTFTFCGHSGSSYGVTTGMDFIFNPYNQVGVVILTNGESSTGRNIIWDALYIFASTIPTNLAEDLESSPRQYYLSQNYPNPFNPSTKIKYSVPQSSDVVIKVFDVLGNEIETLVNEEKPAGTYEITWNATNLPSGVYFYQLKAGEYISAKKMTFLK